MTDSKYFGCAFGHVEVTDAEFEKIYGVNIVSPGKDKLEKMTSGPGETQSGRG